MSFQAYLDNIKSKTGKSPEDLKLLAEKAGVLRPEMKASELVAWLGANPRWQVGVGTKLPLRLVQG